MLNIRIPEEETELRPRITVIGCGGAGSNGVNNMISSGLQGVEFLVCNSDAQSLKMSLADRKIQLGLNVTRGLGAGARPDVGRAAAEEALDEIMGYLEGSNMVFITAGMGGGTGTGGAPIIARAAKEAGILTVGVVTKPFHFEGAHRMRLADAGIEELQQHVDTLLIIPNQNLFRVANEKTTFADAFKMADEVLHAGVRGVTDLMVMPGLINLDFADIRSVMSEMGKAMMGTGESSSTERRAIEAAEAAINNPLLEDASMQGAKGLLINITGGMDMTLYEVDEACNRIRDEVDPDANIIFGSTFSPDLDGKIRVSVVATGIDSGLRNYKTGGTTSPEQQPLASQFAAQNKPAVAPAGNFNRGSLLRQGVAPATSTSAVGTATTPVTRQTGTTNARANAVAGNPGFFNRAAAASSAARRVEEEFAPMNSPLTIESLEADTADEAYAPAPQTIEAPSMHYAPQQAAPQVNQHRGERVDDHFIPPMPVMTETKSVSAPAAPQPAQSRRALTDSLMSQELPIIATPQRAPQALAPEAQQTAPKRPGLFDRLTGAAPRQPQAQQQSAPQKTTQSPSLSVDNSDRIPTGTSGFDDDLDIPAFLRRQAN
ncbi:MAG: ftsZ [Alphaproteobacteria bacterium]|nr:ftsZ [Alphaproteobacteria bacterium]